MTMLHVYIVLLSVRYNDPQSSEEMSGALASSIELRRHGLAHHTQIVFLLLTSPLRVVNAHTHSLFVFSAKALVSFGCAP